ncbi:TIPIN-like protein [Mya arenaria]|uniref:TIMELESS-interacting protein n=1 Tax=Mya arenaria TaxID=6604 RepID=A0ABY7G5A2_MYAAR|nr:TIPIN-like protein [Mya arenaria]
METADLDMDGIFDDRDEDEDLGAIGALPDLPDGTQQASQDMEDEENAEVLARLKDISKGAAKRVIRRPQPKLDSTRLTGDRGIPILRKTFDKASDLACIMKELEHWGHRLFPKMTFDEVIERVEKLGAKKEVQTCVKKIRMDMPVLSEDFVGSDKEDDEVERVGDMVDAFDQDQPAKNPNAEDMWDDLIRVEDELQETSAMASRPTGLTAGGHVTSPGAVVGAAHSPEREASQHGEPEFTATRIDTPGRGTASAKAAECGGFTPEQLARIEKNKQLALERRLKKTGRFTPGKQTASPSPSQRLDTVTQSSQQTPSQASSLVDKSDTSSTPAQQSTSQESDSAASQSSEPPRLNLKLSQDSQDSQDGEEQITASESLPEKMSNCGEKVANEDQNSDNQSHQNKLGSKAGEKEERNDMSEELTKGSSQNIKVMDPNASLGQRMDNETPEVTVSERSRSHSGSENVKGQNDVPDMENIPNGILDSDEEMSAVIDKECSENKVLKTKENVSNVNMSSEEKSEIITDHHAKKTNVLKTKNLDNKENVLNEGIDSKKLIVEGQENLLNDVAKMDTDNSVAKGTVDMTGDHGNKTDSENCEVEEQLTEDQLMDTLES